MSIGSSRTHFHVHSNRPISGPTDANEMLISFNCVTAHSLYFGFKPMLFKQGPYVTTVLINRRWRRPPTKASARLRRRQAQTACTFRLRRFLSYRTDFSSSAVQNPRFTDRGTGRPSFDEGSCDEVRNRKLSQGVGCFTAFSAPHLTGVFHLFRLPLLRSEVREMRELYRRASSTLPQQPDVRKGPYLPSRSGGEMAMAAPRWGVAETPLPAKSQGEDPRLYF